MSILTSLPLVSQLYNVYRTRQQFNKCEAVDEKAKIKAEVEKRAGSIFQKVSDLLKPRETQTTTSFVNHVDKAHSKNSVHRLSPSAEGAFSIVTKVEEVCEPEDFSRCELGSGWDDALYAKLGDLSGERAQAYQHARLSMAIFTLVVGVIAVTTFTSPRIKHLIGPASAAAAAFFWVNRLANTDALSSAIAYKFAASHKGSAYLQERYIHWKNQKGDLVLSALERVQPSLRSLR